MGIRILCDRCGNYWYKDTDWDGDECPHSKQIDNPNKKDGETN
jgi:hypothetical protein